MAVSGGFGHLSKQEWNRLQEAAGRFEQAWQSGEPPDLGAFLPPTNDGLRSTILHELIKIDLEMRIRRTPGVRLDEYCERFRELGPPATLPVSLIYEEYRVRQRYGDRPDLDQYRERFPVQFVELQRLVDEPGTLRSIRRDPNLHQDTFAAGETPSPPSSSQPAPAPPVFGEQLIPSGQGYLKRQYIGGGTFADVWRGEAPGGCPVAIKIIRRPVDHEDVQGELQALELIKSLSHPFLARIDAFWVVDNRMHVAMELAEGTLRQRLKDCKAAGKPAVPLDELRVYFREAAEAIDYLHSENIIHRDIKPENILLLKGHAKLADLGLAREVEDRVQMSSTGVGTPRYMAPEVWQRRISKHSDQYSLAVSYAELRMGRPPFSSGNLADAMIDAIGGQPDLSDMPEAERQVVAKAMAKEPAERYPSCQEFIAALELAYKAPDVADDGIVALSTPPPSWQAAPARAPEANGSGRFRPWAIVASAAVVVVAASAMVYFRPWELPHPTARAPIPHDTEVVAPIHTVVEWPGTIDLAPQPRDAKVFIDGKEQPAGMQHFLLKAGGHRVRVVRDGYDPFEQEFTVVAGQSIAAPVTLRKRIVAAPSPPAPPERRPSLYEQLVRGSAWVRCYFPGSDGRGSRLVSGMACVVDSNKRLLLTNHHVVENLAARGDDKVFDTCVTVELVFPVWQGNTLIVQKDYYENAIQHGQLKPIRARVINSDPGRDLALLQADSLPAGTVALRLAQNPAQPPDHLHSLGNSSREGLWTATEGSARLVYQATQDYANGQHLHAWVVENQSPTNRGDSGGPVVNDAGDLVAVTSSRSGSPDANLVGWFIDIREVKSLLAESQPWLECHSAAEHLKRADYYVGRKLYSLAMADLSWAVEHGDPGAVARYKLGRVCLRKGNWREAVDNLTTAETAGYAGKIGLYLDRAEANYYLHDYRAVIKDAERVPTLSGVTAKKKAQALSRAGDAYAELKNDDKAMKCYDRAIKAWPKDARTFNARGLLHVDKREYQAAVRDYSAAVRLGHVPDAVKAFFYFNRGLAHRAQGAQNAKEYDAAIADFNDAVQLDPKQARFFNDRAIAYRLMKKFDEALVDHEQALMLDPQNAEFLNSRGLTHAWNGEYEKAVNDYTDAIKIHPKAAYYYNRGQAYESLEKQAKAKENYRKALDLDAAFKPAKDALRELSSGS